MAVDASYIAAISRGKYTVGSASTDTITSETLTMFLNVATDMVTQDVPTGTLTANQLDLAKAYLICNMLETGAFNFTGESIGDYSYSKGAGSGWLAAYQEIVTKANASATRATYKASTGNVRNDATLNDLGFDGTTATIGPDTTT
jgi:hypothetical protein